MVWLVYFLHLDYFYIKLPVLLSLAKHAGPFGFEIKRVECIFLSDDLAYRALKFKIFRR